MQITTTRKLSIPKQLTENDFDWSTAQALEVLDGYEIKLKQGALAGSEYEIFQTATLVYTKETGSPEWLLMLGTDEDDPVFNLTWELDEVSERKLLARLLNAWFSEK